MGIARGVAMPKESATPIEVLEIALNVYRDGQPLAKLLSPEHLRQARSELLTQRSKFYALKGQEAPPFDFSAPAAKTTDAPRGVSSSEKPDPGIARIKRIFSGEERF
jgi:hypothetical protein